MGKPLPSSFAVTCTSGRWFAISRSDQPHHREFDRQALRVDEAGALVVASAEAPLVPKLAPRRRPLPRVRN